MEEDFDINEVAFTIEVGSEVIEKVRKGDIRCLLYDWKHVGWSTQQKMAENMRKNIDITKVAVSLELDSDAIEE